jgi:hypothetical protein
MSKNSAVSSRQPASGSTDTLFDWAGASCIEDHCKIPDIQETSSRKTDQKDVTHLWESGVLDRCLSFYVRWLICKIVFIGFPSTHNGFRDAEVISSFRDESYLRKSNKL